MSSSLPLPVRHLSDQDAQARETSHEHVSMPVQIAGTHALPVAVSSSAVQFPPPPLQLHHVPSSTATSVNVVADAYNSSSSGSSACGDIGCVGNGSCPGSLGVPLPAVPTRRMREFIPESKKDDEYWMKRQKNNEAAKRSREKRRANDTVMMRRIHELAGENKRLKLELEVLRRQLGMLPASSESQPPSAAAAGSGLDATARVPAAEQISRPSLDSLPSLITCYENTPRNVVTTGAYRSLSGEQKPWPPDEPHLHHNQPAAASCAAADWRTTYPVNAPSINAPFSTSSTDARTLATSYRYSTTSGNSLPSIGNLCSGAPQQDNGSGVPPSYRSTTDDDRASSQPPTVVDSTPIVIFSDVSSSEDESVDDSWFGKHVHTLTLRRSVEEVGGTRGVAESPLNLSTPARHQTKRAYGTDASDVAQAGAPWLPSKTVSEPVSEPVAAGQHRGRSNYEPHGRTPHAGEWLPASTGGSPSEDARSRSTSLSSVASVAWQPGADVAAPAADSEHPNPADRQARCGLPLKVRRKMGSDRQSVDDAPRPQYDGVALARRQLWSAEHGSTPSSPETSGLKFSLSPEWFRSAATERRLAGMSNLDLVDPRGNRYD